jgi:hypothetical protein
MWAYEEQGMQCVYTTALCGAFMECLFLLSCLYSLIPFHTERALLWQLNVSSNTKMYFGHHVKCLIFLHGCKQVGIFSADFLRSPQYQISYKSVHTDTYRQTDCWMDMTKPVGPFCNYANASKNIHP